MMASLFMIGIRVEIIERINKVYIQINLNNLMRKCVEVFKNGRSKICKDTMKVHLCYRHTLL